MSRFAATTIALRPRTGKALMTNPSGPASRSAAASGRDAIAGEFAGVPTTSEPSRVGASVTATRRPSNPFRPRASSSRAACIVGSPDVRTSSLMAARYSARRAVSATRA